MDFSSVDDDDLASLIVHRGDADAVRALLDAGYNPNGTRHKPGRMSWPVLLCAATVHKRTKIARMLLEYGADMHASYPCGSRGILADALYAGDAAQVATNTR